MNTQPARGISAGTQSSPKIWQSATPMFIIGILPIGQDMTPQEIDAWKPYFEQVAKEHGVPVERVYSSLGRNRGYIDLAVNLPFVLLYSLVAVAATLRMWRRYPPPEDGWITGATTILLLSLAFAVAGTMLSGLWSGIAEQFRVGNGHMSYRGQRGPWSRHGTALFASMFILFWLAAIEVTRRMRSKRSSHPQENKQCEFHLS